jgi:hypothetical protein
VGLVEAYTTSELPSSASLTAVITTASRSTVTRGATSRAPLTDRSGRLIRRPSHTASPMPAPGIRTLRAEAGRRGLTEVRSVTTDYSDAEGAAVTAGSWRSALPRLP